MRTYKHADEWPMTERRKGLQKPTRTMQEGPSCCLTLARTEFPIGDATGQIHLLFISQDVPKQSFPPGRIQRLRYLCPAAQDGRYSLSTSVEQNLQSENIILYARKKQSMAQLPMAS